MRRNLKVGQVTVGEKLRGVIPWGEGGHLISSVGVLLKGQGPPRNNMGEGGDLRHRSKGTTAVLEGAKYKLQVYETDLRRRAESDRTCAGGGCWGGRSLLSASMEKPEDGEGGVMTFIRSERDQIWSPQEIIMDTFKHNCRLENKGGEFRVPYIIIGIGKEAIIL